MIKKEIKIKPEVLKALIRLSGFDEKEISEKLKISLQRIDEGKITLGQLKKLAQTLKRPIVAFFSDEIPVLQAIPDYRLNREKRINSEVFLAQRKLTYLIDKLRELKTVKSNIPEFPLTLPPEKLAKEFRNFIEVDLIKNQKPHVLLEIYKNKIEAKLNLIIIEYPLKPAKKKENSDDVRAFSIYYPDLSGIVLNESDHPSVKLFSLFHEMCHILRKNSGVCSLEYEVEREFKEESYCNKFSAEFLIPIEDLKIELKKSKINENNILSIIEEISKIYGVSKRVILLRLLYLKEINETKYYELKKILEEKKKEEAVKGYKNWEGVLRNRTGNLVIKRVKEALFQEKISYYEALNILDLKSKYAEKLLYSEQKTAT